MSSLRNRPCMSLPPAGARFTVFFLPFCVWFKKQPQILTVKRKTLKSNSLGLESLHLSSLVDLKAAVLLAPVITTE